MLKKETLVEMMKQDLKGAEDAYFEAKEKMTLREVDELWQQVPVDREKKWVTEKLDELMSQKLLRVDELAEGMCEWVDLNGVEELDEDVAMAFLGVHIIDMYLEPLTMFYVAAIDFFSCWYAYELIEASIRTNEKYQRLARKVLKQF